MLPNKTGIGFLFEALEILFGKDESKTQNANSDNGTINSPNEESTKRQKNEREERERERDKNNEEERY